MYRHTRNDLIMLLSDVYLCSKKHYHWHEAVSVCINYGGFPVAVHDLNWIIWSHMNIQGGADIWTADYTVIQDNINLSGTSIAAASLFVASIISRNTTTIERRTGIKWNNTFSLFLNMSTGWKKNTYIDILVKQLY